jgi:nitroreductase
MTFLELVKQRKSVRRFLDKPVEREKLLTCLEAARLAPSACNSQPWHFIVVDDKEIKDRLAQSFHGVYALNTFSRQAPVIVAVVSERSKFLAAIGGLLRATRYYLVDIGIATEHFVLQAEELGLGTCWMGWFNERAVKSALGIPRDRRVEMLIALGYPDTGRPARAPNREPMESVSSFNRY